jgi:hypothetical protein
VKKEYGNKTVKPQTNTWIAAQGSEYHKYVKVSVELNSMVLFFTRSNKKNVTRVDRDIVCRRSSNECISELERI